MKKINGGFTSLYEYYLANPDPEIVHHFAVFTYYLSEKFFPRINIPSQRVAPYRDRYNEHPREPWLDQMLGALQPLVAMIQDTQYTFKPYKSKRDALNDALQPLRGLRNIVRGSINFVAVPILWPVNLLRYAIMARSFNEFGIRVLHYSLLCVSWLIDGTTSIVRGITQLLTTPLTWFIKLPLRAAITFFTGTPDICQNEEIQRLVQLGVTVVQPQEKEEEDVTTAETMDAIRHRLHEEYCKAKHRGQPSIITPETEKKTFEAVHLKQSSSYTVPVKQANKDSFSAYLRLFYRNNNGNNAHGTNTPATPVVS